MTVGQANGFDKSSGLCSTINCGSFVIPLLMYSHVRTISMPYGLQNAIAPHTTAMPTNPADSPHDFASGHFSNFTSTHPAPAIASVASPPIVPPWMFVHTQYSGTSQRSCQSLMRRASYSLSIQNVTTMPIMVKRCGRTWKCVLAANNVKNVAPMAKIGCKPVRSSCVASHAYNPATSAVASTSWVSNPLTR